MIVIVRLPEGTEILRSPIMIDEFDEGIEGNGSSSGGSKLAIVAILIGMIGIGVGITGMVMANTAQKSLKTMEARRLSEPDRPAQLQRSIDEMDDRLVKLGSEFVRLGRQERQLQESMQAAFDSVLRDVKTNRDGINNLTTRLTELVGKLENWSPPRATPARTDPPAVSPETPSMPPSENGDQRIHIVQSGDTFSRIATRYGVTLTQIQQANPSVNPRALQIGQEIVIP